MAPTNSEWRFRARCDTVDVSPICNFKAWASPNLSATYVPSLSGHLLSSESLVAAQNKNSETKRLATDSIGLEI